MHSKESGLDREHCGGDQSAMRVGRREDCDGGNKVRREGEGGGEA
jgi:hypothetical protein